MNVLRTGPEGTAVLQNARPKFEILGCATLS